MDYKYRRETEKKNLIQWRGMSEEHGTPKVPSYKFEKFSNFFT